MSRVSFLALAISVNQGNAIAVERKRRLEGDESHMPFNPTFAPIGQA
jgi:hypothetical protein